MGTCLIEVGTIGLQDAEELLLVQDQQVIQTLTAHAPQETLTVRIGAGSVERRLQDLDPEPLATRAKRGPNLLRYHG